MNKNTFISPKARPSRLINAIPFGKFKANLLTIKLILRKNNMK